MKLYHHKTDGGAEYLCSSKVKGTEDEGSFDSNYVVRIDGDITKDAELSISNEIEELTKEEKNIIKDALGKDFSLGKNYETIIKKLNLFKD